MSNETKSEIFSWIKMIVVAFGLALIIDNFLIVNAYVPTSSMVETIDEKSRILGSRLSYMFKDPERYDIAIFVYPDSEPDDEELFVKRVIGLPGDTVEIIDGDVYINGEEEPLRDDFVRPFIVDLTNWGPEVVPDDHYFVLGDNRTNSKDSRFWENTYVPREDMIGRVFLAYWPQPKIYRKMD